jgi:hypothetical protein
MVMMMIIMTCISLHATHGFAEVGSCRAAHLLLMSWVSNCQQQQQ